jgi:uncharacterized flavoprotein (TIGR03862 family)
MTIAIIGGGPAGLMAAEAAQAGGARVDLYDAMPTVGRKFLVAGKGGLNLTHSEPLDAFLSRYGARRAHIAPLLSAFDPDALRAWAAGLGVDTFVGTSGRVFPKDLKAAPLLRAWVRRLRHNGVAFHLRHRWCGWNDRGALCFATGEGVVTVQPDAVVMALGGASWPHLGSDGAWVPLLRKHGADIAPLQPANCGFDVGWTDHFRTRFAGQPVKSIAVSVTTAEGIESNQRGEFVITESGIEGGVIYSVSGCLRDAIRATGIATVRIDLVPDRDMGRLIKDLSQPRGSRTMATHLQRRAGLTGVKAGLLREVLPPSDFADPVRLGAAIKALPLRLRSPRPIVEAISTSGGVTFDALDARLMIRARPGVFCAGEMLDWEAPTGGYLLTACFATGLAAGRGAVEWLQAGGSTNESR